MKRVLMECTGLTPVAHSHFLQAAVSSLLRQVQMERITVWEKQNSTGWDKRLKLASKEQ